MPDKLGACVELEELFLSENKLSSAIPPSMGKLVKLKDLQLYDNALEGRVPDKLRACVELEPHSSTVFDDSTQWLLNRSE